MTECMKELYDIAI